MKLNKKNLICAMIDAGMNNKQLSQASGVSISRISYIKNGETCLYDTAVKIAKALNIPVQSLIEDDNK